MAEARRPVSLARAATLDGCGGVRHPGAAAAERWREGRRFSMFGVVSVPRARLALGIVAVIGIGLVALAHVERAGAQTGMRVTTSDESVSLEAAQAMLAASQAHGVQLGLNMSIVIVDPAGNLKALARMDGASLFGLGLVQDKAYTAAIRRR